MADDDTLPLRVEWSPEPWTQQAAAIAAAYLGNPSTVLDPEKVHGVVADIYLAVGGNFMFPKSEEESDAPRPPVPIAESIGSDYLVCLEDGVRLKMLKRYLRTHHQMTPEEYRAKWRLPSDYPMVAPSYADERSRLAKAQGLGGRPR